MKRKLKSILGILVLVMLLCAVVGITAFAEKAMNEEKSESSFVDGVGKASPSEPEEETTEEETTEEETTEEETTEEETTEEETTEEETVPVESRLARVASDSNAEFIPVENPVWQIGENSLGDKDYPGWATWNNKQLTQEELSRVRAISIDVYKDGELIGGGNYDDKEEQLAADLRYYFKDEGIYQFRAAYIMSSDWNVPDDKWSEYSDEYAYKPLAKKISTPTGLEWLPDGTAKWKDIPDVELYRGAKQYVTELYCKNTETGEYESIDKGGFAGSKPKTTRFIREMEAGKIYKFKIVALGDLIEYSNSDASEFSKEFVMDEKLGEANSIIDGMNTGDVANNVNNAKLTEDEKGNLKLAIQTYSSAAQNYADLEESYKGKAGKKDLNIATGDSGVDVDSVEVIGGILNGATGIKLEKPTQADLDKAGVTNYRKYSALNISLEGGPSGELKFPVLITIPIPKGLSAKELTIIHVKHNGDHETLLPRISDDGETATFAVTEFSSFIFVDNTTTGGGSTGGSNGGGGGSSGGGRSSATSNPLEVPGAWSLNEFGWTFARLDGKAIASQWVMNGGNWFHFNETGYMMTGWFTDIDGKKFYLNPVSDGTMGAMKTGWQMIEGKWYYFNPISDGTRGALLTNTTTPDGFVVNADGVWIQ